METIEMNAVERVKAICKERKIPISKLESDLGFGNAYISGLKKGSFPNNRLEKIAEYLDISSYYLSTGEESIEETATLDARLTELDNRLKEYMLKLNQLSEEKQECVMKLIDLLK